MTGTEASTEDRKRPIRKFNPGLLQSDEEVIEQFVVRRHEFRIVREVLQGNIGAPSCQHLLVVAPRGRGKTMLLARVAAELRRSREFAGHLLPVRFMEESQEIYDLADFWLETLFHLAREIAATDPGFSRELSETHRALSARWREEGLEAAARAAVLDAADRLGRRLVLMVENLQALCRTVDGEFGWGLRGVLQTEPQIMLLASATSRFGGLEDARDPFFELFRFVHLPPLGTEGCRRLWTVVSGQELSGREIRPLEILTGGSPRLLVLAAAFAQHLSVRRLLEELVSLVDEHTEYFRSNLGSLPKNERRVYVALIDLWKPSSTGEIAARARLGVRITSTMLGRLVARGAVAAEPDGVGRKRLYAASEPLYSIYYKLRRGRDEAAVVETLIRFMVVFYDVGEIWRVSEQLQREARESRAIHAGIERALAERPSSENPRSRMKWDAVARASDQARAFHSASAQRKLQEDIAAASEEEDWKRVLEIVDEYVAGGWLDAESEREREDSWAYLAHMRSNAHFMLNDLDEAVAIGEEVAERYGDTQDTELLSRSCAVALNKAAANLMLGNYLGARTDSRWIADRFGEHGARSFQEQVAAALLLQAEAENELGNVGNAIVVLDEVLERCGESDATTVQVSVAKSLVLKGRLVGWGQGDFRGAAAIFGDAVKRFGGSDHSEIRTSVMGARMHRALVCAAIGDFDEEIASYGELIAAADGRDSAPEKWLAVIASALKSRRLAELGRVDEALETCDDCIRRIEEDSTGDWRVETRIWMDWHTKCSRALALMRGGASEPAMDAFGAAYAVFQPDGFPAMGEMLRLVPELIAAGASEHDLIGVLTDDDEKSVALRPLVVALRQRTGEPVRASAEVLQVAADLRRTIAERIANGVMPGFILPVPGFSLSSTT